MSKFPKTIEEWDRRMWEAGDQIIPMTICLWRLGKKRKLRLFSLACFEIIRPYVTDPRSLAAVAFFERHIEKSGVTGRAGRPAIAAAAQAAAFEIRDRSIDIYGGVSVTPEQYDNTLAHMAAWQLVGGDSADASACGQFAAQIQLGKWALASGHWPPEFINPAVSAAWTTHQQEIIKLLKDVVNDPFQSVAFSPSWRSDTALSLARQMYETRDFGEMLILADALQDAGCEDEQILNHCRDVNATHVRGCWVVDLVLDKA